MKGGEATQKLQDQTRINLIITWKLKDLYYYLI